MSSAGVADTAEIVIAGAGPAGIATAVAAVRADPSLKGRVLVLDRASFPRAKPCGGGLTGHIEEAMAALGLSLTVPSFSSSRALVRYGSLARTVSLARPVRTVRREHFDQSLVEQARALGVEVREGTGLVGYTVEREGVAIATTRGPLRARILVGADGAGSLVRKVLSGLRPSAAPTSHVGAGNGAADTHGTERGGAMGPHGSEQGGERVRPIRLFRAELPDRGWNRDEMLYDFTPMIDGLRGYLWIFPVPGGLINVGVMHDPHVPLTGGELAALLRRRLRDHGICLDGAALRGWPAWGYLPARRVSAPRVLTVGDAAGIDALTGEGIAVALEQGLVAGGAAAAALGSGDFRFAGYRSALRRAVVGRELALDRWLAKLLYGTANYRRWLSLVLHDEVVLDLYAARVSGGVILADHKRALFAALAGHALHGRSRMRALREAEAGPFRLDSAA